MTAPVEEPLHDEWVPDGWPADGSDPTDVECRCGELTSCIACAQRFLGGRR